MPSPVHEALTPLSWLAGSWFSTDGQGIYPNIKSFQYHETLEFQCVGQPMFNFISTSKHAEKQTVMHQERGFLRIKPGTKDLAFVVSHNFGLTSIEEGFCDEERKEILLESTNIHRISFAKSPAVKKFKRHIRLISPDQLEITLQMETENTPMTEHLKATYKKVT